MAREYCFPALLSFGYEGGRLWVANFVGLHGCWVEGEERDDVIARVSPVLREYLRCCDEAGINIPEAPDADELRQLNIGEVLQVRAVI